LRRVALLCGVFVRLHLALFPAGGPFLPSLYVNLYMWGKSSSHVRTCLDIKLTVEIQPGGISSPL
jgi:hypothetical protein